MLFLLKTKKHGDLVVNAINTPEFKEIIKNTKWAAFQTDWRMFKHFKTDFYKTFQVSSNKTVKRKKRLISGTKKKNKLPNTYFYLNSINSTSV